MESGADQLPVEKGECEMITNDYIGDGVYVDFDGCGIWLYANDFDEPTDKIYLEQEVLEALIRFSERIGARK